LQDCTLEKEVIENGALCCWKGHVLPTILFYIPPVILRVSASKKHEVKFVVSVSSRGIEELKQRVESAGSQLGMAIAKEKEKNTHEAVLSELSSVETLLDLKTKIDTLLPEFGEDLLKMLNFIREERKSVRDEFRGQYELIEKRIMRALEASRKIKKA
jgi:hypothetical protein